MDRESIRAALHAAGLDFDPAAVPAEPTSGPSILFFSGGSALREVSASLARLTHNSVHVVTTFDSGGSSAEVRRAFGMPAPGDLRLRMSSLADQANMHIHKAAVFFERRLSSNADQAALRAELKCLASGEHDWLEGLEDNTRKVFASALGAFLSGMPADFDLHGAALGNLLLAADYLDGGSLNQSVNRFARILSVRGRVLPVSEESVHLAVRLDNGEVLTGQHRFTGKGGILCPPGGHLIKEMFFYRPEEQVDGWLPSDNSPIPSVGPTCLSQVLDEISNCQLICYPLGSFYSSLLANLRVEGVGKAIRKSGARKIYVPNPGEDPESYGLSLKERIELICRAVSKSSEPKGIVDGLLLDSSIVPEPGLDAWLKENEIPIIRYAYCDKTTEGRIIANPEKLAHILICLSCRM